MKKSLVIGLICFSIIILSLSFASASWFGDFWNKITGKVVSSTQCSDGTNLGQIEIGTGSARWMCTNYTGARENLDCYGGNNNSYLGVEANGWKCGRWGWECGGKEYNSGYCCSGVNQNEECPNMKTCDDVGSLIIGDNKELCADYQGQNQIIKCWDDDDVYNPTDQSTYNNPYLDLELNGWKCERWGWYCNGKASPTGGFCCEGVMQNEKCVQPEVPSENNQLSDFFKSDSTVLSIINGNSYQLSKENFFTSDGEIDALSFEFKLIQSFKQLGYSGLEYNEENPSDSSAVVAFHKFQSKHNLEQSNLVDRDTILLIDKELKERELKDKEIANKYPPFSKFMDGPLNEPSKEHLAGLYYNLFSSFPSNIQAGFYGNKISYSSKIMTLEEFVLFMSWFDDIRYFGKLLDRNVERQLTDTEVYDMIKSDSYNFIFCADAYYSRYMNVGCLNLSSPVYTVHTGSFTSDFSYSTTLAHEFAHFVGNEPAKLVINGVEDYIHKIFGQISFNLSVVDFEEGFPPKQVSLRQKNNDEFVSAYAQTNADEDFAESFSAYIFDGKTFRERAKSNIYLQQKYDFLKKYIFNGQEYDTGSIDSFYWWQAKKKSLPFYSSTAMQEDPNRVWDYKYDILKQVEDNTNANFMQKFIGWLKKVF